MSGTCGTSAENSCAIVVQRILCECGVYSCAGGIRPRHTVLFQQRWIEVPGVPCPILTTRIAKRSMLANLINVGHQDIGDCVFQKLGRDNLIDPISRKRDQILAEVVPPEGTIATRYSRPFSKGTKR